MAFPGAADLLAKLPADGDPLIEADAQVYLTRWVNSLEFQPDTDREWAVAEMVVESGVLAELERDQLRASGRIVPTEIYTRISGARALRKEYNDMRTTEGQELDAPPAYIQEVPW
jgi:hypothetical protein